MADENDHARYSGPTELVVKQRMVQWLRDHMASTGIRAVEVAERCGLSEPTVSNILSGKVKPGFKFAVRIHFGLGAALNEVFRWTHTRVAGRTSQHSDGQTRVAAKTRGNG